MANYNFQITQRNSTNTAWDNMYPATKAEIVNTADGVTLESLLGKTDKQTATIARGINSLTVPQASTASVGITGRNTINLLGIAGNCETLSNFYRASGTGLISLDSTNKLFGNNSVKMTVESGGNVVYAINNYNMVQADKYYCLSAYFKNVSAVECFVVMNGITGSNANDISSFKRSILKISPAQIEVPLDNSKNRFRIWINGSNGTYAYVDGAMLIEITQAEYNDPNYVPPEYVDSFQPVRNPYIVRRGKNLVRNGNGEEGISWWSLSYGAVNPRFENGYFVVEDDSTLYNRGYNQVVPAKPNTQYTFSVIGKRITSNARVQIYEVDEDNLSSSGILLGNTVLTNTVDTKLSVTGTTSANAKRIRVAIISGFTVADVGIAYCKEAMLVEGSSTPSIYEPYNEDYLFFETDLYDGENLQEVDGKYIRYKKWNKITLDNKFTTTISSFTPVRKNIRISDCLYNVNTVINGALVLNCIKYDGKILKLDTLTDIDQFTTDRPNGIVWLSVSNNETGWGESYTPTSDEINAYLLGWVMSDANGNHYSGGQKFWTRIYCGIGTSTASTSFGMKVIGAYTNTCPTVMNDQGYTPYEMHYQLANPITEEVKTEGSLSLVEGINNFEVGEGIIIRENIREFGSWSNGIYLGDTSTTEPQFKYNPYKILNLYKNNYEDIGKWYSYYSPTNIQGLDKLTTTKNNYDSNAVYTTTYIMIDKYKFSSSIPNITLYYNNTLRQATNVLLDKATDILNESNINKLAIYNSEYMENFKSDSMKGTIVIPTLDSNGNVTKIDHKRVSDGAILRTDIFDYSILNQIIETRKDALINKTVIKYTYHLDTLQTEVL
jgi:hypothetical protein